MNNCHHLMRTFFIWSFYAYWYNLDRQKGALLLQWKTWQKSSPSNRKRAPHSERVRGLFTDGVCSASGWSWSMSSGAMSAGAGTSALCYNVEDHTRGTNLVHLNITLQNKVEWFQTKKKKNSYISKFFNTEKGTLNRPKRKAYLIQPKNG